MGQQDEMSHKTSNNNAPSTHTQIRAIVGGRVQGVFFRASTHEQAQKLALRGSVRNLPDQTVEIIAQGPLSAILELLKWAHRGPIHANPTHLKIETMSIEQQLPAFTVLR